MNSALVCFLGFDLNLKRELELKLQALPHYRAVPIRQTQLPNPVLIHIQIEDGGHEWRWWQKQGNHGQTIKMPLLDQRTLSPTPPGSKPRDLGVPFCGRQHTQTITRLHVYNYTGFRPKEACPLSLLHFFPILCYIGVYNTWELLDNVEVVNQVITSLSALLSTSETAIIENFFVTLTRHCVEEHA